MATHDTRPGTLIEVLCNEELTALLTAFAVCHLTRPSPYFPLEADALVHRHACQNLLKLSLRLKRKYYPRPLKIHLP